MRRTAKEKKNIPLRLAAILLCLTLFSAYLTAGLFARYTVQGNSGDTARVAGFHPTATLTPTNPADSKIIYEVGAAKYDLTYNITITNPSEVAVTYDVVISFADDKLNGAIFNFNGETQTVSGSGSLTFEDGDVVLAANDTVGLSRSLIVTVGQDIVKAMIAAADGKLDLTDYFTVTVTFTQVD